MRLRALRGAITVERNDADAILDATEELLRAVIERNQLAVHDLVSCIFTTTDDLNAEFPAVAARRIGLSSVPLLGAREMQRPGALERVIRVMVHCYAPEDRPSQHVYLRDATVLRQDLQGAQ